MGSNGSPVGRPISTLLAVDQTRIELSTEIDNPAPWSAESPTLYSLESRLSRAGELLHRHTEEFGFRTVEVRRGEGLFVNDQRVLLKGVNRHSFWPTSGRTLNRIMNGSGSENIGV